MTELIWDGKYKDGKRVGPLRVALPFQTIETVNESAQERDRNLLAAADEIEWRNLEVSQKGFEAMQPTLLDDLWHF